MELRPLGRSGVRVSALSLGTMMFGRGGNTDVDSCVQMVHSALDAGINLFDTADGYGLGDSEEILGRALQGAGRREDAIVATKCFFPRGRDPNRRGGSRRWIMQACDDSLRRLGVDHIDLYQLHRLDPNADLDESVAAMADLVRAGKVRMVGTSGAGAADLVELMWIGERNPGRARPVCEQSPYSIFTRAIEKAVLPAAARHGIGVIVYGPLNGGWLTGKYDRSSSPPAESRAGRRFYDRAWWDYERVEVLRKFAVLDELRVVAADAGLPLAQLAIAFCLAHPAVTSAIIGPRTPEQLEGLLSLGDTRLSNDVLDRIDALVAPGTDIDPANMVSFDTALASTQRRRGRRSRSPSP